MWGKLETKHVTWALLVRNNFFMDYQNTLRS
jgi:hypothetical protein